ncbi:MAG: ATP-dependent DNA helicase RecG, partial [Crocinitomicaceae bacterium]
MTEFLNTSIEYLKGVGPQRAQLLQSELGIFSFQDLLEHFPFRYLDRSTYHSVEEAPFADNYVQLKGKITGLREIGTGRHKKLFARFTDNTGSIDLVWFQGIQWIKPNLKPDIEYQIFGKPKLYVNQWNIPHPELAIYSEVRNKTGLQAFYPSTEKLTSKGLHSKGIEKLIGTLIPQIENKIPETLPEWIINEYHLLSR